MSIVSNASPLINLARIEKLSVLQELYGELIIPGAVWQEIVVEGVELISINEKGGSKWISIHLF